MKDGRSAAQRYAKALLVLSGQDAKTGKVQNDLAGIVHSMRLKEKPWELLRNPLAGQKEKAQAIMTALEGRVESSTLKLLKVLALRHQIGLLPLIADRLNILSDEASGIARASVRTAFPLSTEQTTALANKLEGFCKKKIVLETKEDPGLMGGLVVKVGDYFFEHSLKLELRRLREALAG